MKKYKLTKTEAKILKSFEKGEFKSVKNLKKAKKKYQVLASSFLHKMTTA